EVFEIKNIARGGKVIEPETNPSKINYAFVGWYNGETLWDFDTNIVTKNITLIAKFNLTHYSVEFLVDGEILETRAVVPGKKLVKPENPNKENYIFAGWYNGETLWNFENDVVNENITLTAKFDENAKIDGIDIKINNFELKESPAIGKYYYKTVSNVREIYNFKDDIETPQELKWFVAYNVSGTDKIESTLTEIAVGDNKFYLVVESGNIKETYILVVRRRPMYEVLFDTNGGTKVETQIIEEDFFASVPTEKVEKTGYDFIGWDYDFSMPVKENLIINAKYIPIVYTATFKDDGEYVEERTFIIEDTEILNIPSVPNKVGYTAKWEEYEIKAENITINAVYTPIIYTARFVINSETYTTRTFTIEDSEILDMPRVPSKAGYTGEWESYEIKAENLTIKALLINYTATFIINGETYTTRTFTIEDSEILDMPSVPTKAGYTGKWESYKIKAENIEIKAELITYTANFVINGSTYKTRKFTIEDSEILDKPSVPTKAGYTGEWESYEIKAENIVVNAVYTIINYTATFKADGDVVDTRTFTINDDEIADIPSVPNKMGYTGKWESYTLTLQDIEVNAIYSPVVYTATFKVDGMNNDTRTFTVEDTEISNINSISPAK
ncbi:MAG: InlB B-repeat-containing protein, partial [Clostridia bacterium]|nr:InlB B-repeat-containing protein [Clostridia bacterium]